MSVPAVLPRPAEVIQGARDTRLLLRLRWRLIRGRMPRLMVWLGLGALLAALFIVSNVGFFIRRIAEDGAGTDAAQFAVDYVIALHRGDLGSVGAVALGTAVAAALFSPFSGTANQALANADDLAALRPHRMHRYFDGLVTAGLSAIGFMQLFALTAVASLLTLDGGRVGGLLLTWAVWPTLVLVATAEGWAIELVHRTLGARARRSIGLTLAGIVGVAVLLDPAHGQTLFGLGTAYSAALRAAAAGDTGPVLIALGVLATVGAAAFVAGLVLCRTALEHPAVSSAGTREHKRHLPLSRRPRIALIQVLTSDMLRTREVRVPILMLLAIGVPAAWLAGSVPTMMSTLVIAGPLAIALVWGANVFGIIGGGMTWLASQPHVLRWLLPLSIGIQFGAVAIIAVLCWLPPTLLGVIAPGDVAGVAAGLVISTALISTSAARKSVHRPLLTRLGTRGDVLIPPLRAINYTIRFAVWGGQIGVLALNRDDRWIQIGLVAAVLCWTGLRLLWLLHQWDNRDRQARVIGTVAAA